MPVVFGYQDAAMFVGSSNASVGRGGDMASIDTSPVEESPGGGGGSLTAPGWDPSFHGSVHTATMAVCTVLVIFVVVLGTFGNGLVLVSALQCHHRRLRSNFDALVYNLAAADFIVCSCLAPTFLYLLFSPSLLPAPREFCGGFLFACTLCGLASLLTLVAIATHRQSRVMGKVKGALTLGRTAAILGAVYFVSLGAALGGTLHVTLGWADGQTTCQAVIHSSRVTSNNVILFFITPVVAVSCVTILVSYCVIARAVRTQTYLRVKALQPLLKTSGYSKLQPAAAVDITTAVGTAGSVNNPQPHPCSELKQILVETGSLVSPTTKTTTAVGTSEEGLRPSEKKREKKEKETLRHCACCSCMAALDKENKAVTMCLVVILIIALCWMPLVASHVIELMTGDSIILYQVKLCGIALVFLNSALDPYMYAQNCGRSSSSSSASSSHRFASFLWDVFRCECRLPRPHYRTRVGRHTAAGTATKVAGGVVSLGATRAGLRNQAVVPGTAACIVGPDCATLQFLQPPDPPPTPRGTIAAGVAVKTSSVRGVKNSNYIVNSSSKSRKNTTKSCNCRHHKVYSSNILRFGHTNLVGENHLMKSEVRHSRRSHAQAGVMSDVRTLVHKSCCHGNSPDDLSLIDS